MKPLINRLREKPTRAGVHRPSHGMYVPPRQPEDSARSVVRSEKLDDVADRSMVAAANGVETTGLSIDAADGAEATGESSSWIASTEPGDTCAIEGPQRPAEL